MLTSLQTQNLKLTIWGSNIRWMVVFLEDMLSAILVMSYGIQTSRTWACPIFVTTWKRNLT